MLSQIGSCYNGAISEIILAKTVSQNYAWERILKHFDRNNKYWIFTKVKSFYSVKYGSSNISPFILSSSLFCFGIFYCFGFNLKKSWRFNQKVLNGILDIFILFFNLFEQLFKSDWQMCLIFFSMWSKW